LQKSGRSVDEDIKDLAGPTQWFRHAVESIKNKKIELEVKMPKAQTKEAGEAAKEKEVAKEKEAAKEKEMVKEKEAPKEKEVVKEREAPKEKEVAKEKEMVKGKREKGELTKEQFFGHLDNLTVLELADYIKEFEERYGVSAAAPVAMAAPGTAAPQGDAPAEEEKAAFTVILKGVGDKKINVIKTVREVTSLGLKEAKDLVDNAPKPVKENVSKEEAEEMKAKFEAVGAEVELQ
jgi:large subunit ribosomal protein L7/L12